VSVPEPERAEPLGDPSEPERAEPDRLGGERAMLDYYRASLLR
jgi:hypothetical protein